ncbi:MAG: OadG family protein [Ruminococcaceae bacterium]|nr:OadG family protein [Oscillospiraceae bacterium]
MSIGDSLLMSALGMVVVFAVLFLLILVIIATSAVVSRNKKGEEVSPKADSSIKSSGPVRKVNAGFGSIKTYDVPDVTVAMIMAIVADQLEIPLNQLRFISIREVK